MKKKRISYFMVACLMVSVVWTTVRADSLITPVAATAESYFRAGVNDKRAPVCTINSSYMSPLPVTASSAASTQYMHGMWLSNGTKATWITFDLGCEMTVTGMHVWNCNEVNYSRRGIKTCDLYKGTYLLSSGMPYSYGGAAWGTFVESLTFACAPGAEPYYGEDIWFTEPVTTRYLQLLVTDNYGIDNYTGLSEVRFYSRTSQRWSVTGESAITFAVRSDDLLQTAVVSTVDELSVNNTENDKYSKGTLASLTDGTFGSAGHVDGLCIAGGQVTYNLDTDNMPTGYDISEVDVYTGWGGDRANASFALLYRRVGESTFETVGAAHYACTITSGNRGVRVRMMNLGLKGVDALRFDFGPGDWQQNNGVGYKEIDVYQEIGRPISPVNATAQSWYTPDDRAPIHTVDGSNIAPSREPESVGVVAGTATRSSVWLSDGTVETWIAFDLGVERTVKGFHLWNYNEYAANKSWTGRGIQTAGVYVGETMPENHGAYTDAGAAWGTLVQEMTFTIAPGNGSYVGEDYLFDTPVRGRYFQFVVTSNYGLDAYTGISEIVFYEEVGEMEVTYRDSGLRTIPDVPTTDVVVTEGTGNVAPVTVAESLTRIHTLRSEVYDDMLQLQLDGKTLAVTSIELPSGTSGLEILPGGTLACAPGMRNWLNVRGDADLILHTDIKDDTGGSAVHVVKTGAGTFTIDGTATWKGNVFMTGGRFLQPGGTLETLGATFSDMEAVFSGGTSQAASGYALSSASMTVNGPHTADWRMVRTDSGDCSLSVLDGGVLKVGFIDGGNVRDFPITLDGGTLGTSAFGTASPWIPAVGPVIVGADGAVFDTSEGDATVEAEIDADAVVVRKTGANTLTLKRRVTGATQMIVEEGSLALALPEPIIHYDFNSISGTMVLNLGSGGSALNGVISGTPETVDGVSGSALQFSAEDQGVATANSVTLRQFTYAAWVKSAGEYAKCQRIIIGGLYSPNARTFLGYLGTNNNQYWAFAHDTNNMNSQWVIPDTDNWHHLAVTYDGVNLTLYLDGEEIQSETLACNRMPSTMKIGFGNNVTPNAEYWNGAIDEAMVFDRAITAEEVEMVMNDSWKRMGVLSPDTDLVIAEGATLNLNGSDQTVATLTLGSRMYKYGETTWGPVGSGAEHETDQLSGRGILRVKGPLDPGMYFMIR
ncbi:MAG: hypothetical protein IJU44_04300 [Kiritimatiellae bacterium]|nr:hypothetical protein [Kiritimatiellia bacterium]